MSDNSDIATSVKLLQQAKNVIVVVGAGMSADLGTPTYWTGDHAKYGDTESRFGFTNLEHSSAPLWKTNPEEQSDYFQALYKELLTLPLPSEDENPYMILKKWLGEKNKNYFVVTSNVDTIFTRYGFDTKKLYEIHGAYDRSQCLKNPRGHRVFNTINPSVGKTLCPRCKSRTRPNVLFFNDFSFVRDTNEMQEDSFFDFKDSIYPQETVILEIGVGLTVLNLRNITRKLYAQMDIPVIRINPFHVKKGDHIATGMSPIVEHQLTSIDGLAALLKN